MLVWENFEVKSSIDNSMSMGSVMILDVEDSDGSDFMLRRCVLESICWIGPWLRSYATGSYLLLPWALAFDGVRKLLHISFVCT